MTPRKGADMTPLNGAGARRSVHGTQGVGACAVLGWVLRSGLSGRLREPTQSLSGRLRESVLVPDALNPSLSGRPREPVVVRACRDASEGEGLAYERIGTRPRVRALHMGVAGRIRG
jgi:hypothetical protein